MAGIEFSIFVPPEEICPRCFPHHPTTFPMIGTWESEGCSCAAHFLSGLILGRSFFGQVSLVTPGLQLAAEDQCFEKRI